MHSYNACLRAHEPHTHNAHAKTQTHTQTHTRKHTHAQTHTTNPHTLSPSRGRMDVGARCSSPAKNGGVPFPRRNCAGVPPSLYTLPLFILFFSFFCIKMGAYPSLAGIALVCLRRRMARHCFFVFNFFGDK